MNTKQDFTTFLESLEGIIENGRSEARTPKDSLERMRHVAIRQGRIDDADSIAKFIQKAAHELRFFRSLTQINPLDERTTLLSQLSSWIHLRLKYFKRPITPSTLDKIGQDLTRKKPFLCIEGVFTSSDKSPNEVGSVHLKGPFFAAICANYSGAVDLKKGELVFLFSQAAKAQGNQDKGIELRIWNLETFAGLMSGKSFDNSTLAVPPESNATIVELERGELQGLFQKAVYQMTRAALSTNPPIDLERQFMTFLGEYGKSSSPPVGAAPT